MLVEKRTVESWAIRAERALLGGVNFYRVAATAPKGNYAVPVLEEVKASGCNRPNKENTRNGSRRPDRHNKPNFDCPHLVVVSAVC